jgi:hypothetical protein
MEWKSFLYLSQDGTEKLLIVAGNFSLYVKASIVLLNQDGTENLPQPGWNGEAPDDDE